MRVWIFNLVLFRFLTIFLIAVPIYIVLPSAAFPVTFVLVGRANGA